MQASVMFAITRLLKVMLELQETTQYRAFYTLSGHVDRLAISIRLNKERYDKHVYDREFLLTDKKWIDADTFEDINQVSNLIEYMIQREIECIDYDPEFDNCVWDADRIEATKTVLFHEYIARGGSA